MILAIDLPEITHITLTLNYALFTPFEKEAALFFYFIASHLPMVSLGIRLVLLRR